mgnify:CR=1 FL=1
MEGSDYLGTSIGKGNGSDPGFELDALINETIKESEKLGYKKEKKEETFKATPIIHEQKEAKPIKTESQAPAAESKKVPLQSSPTYQLKDYKAGDIVEGVIVKADPSGLMVDIGYKSEGLVEPLALSPGETTDMFKIGQKIHVFIEKLENKEGFVILSKERADEEVRWKKIYDAFKGRRSLEGKVINVVKGGLILEVLGVRGFIPASQVIKKPEQNIEELKDQTLPVKVIEINRRQGKVVFSHKLAAGEAPRVDKSKLLEGLTTGEVRKGKITSIKSFGVFVDLGGIEGLVHVSELSWKRIPNPADVFKVGDELEVLILGIDKEKGKISLGRKELEPDPWVEALKLYRVGDVVKAKIMRFAKFGAFAELEKGLEGLIHISEITDKPIQKPEDALTVNQEVEVKVLRVIPEEQKIGLSIRAVNESTPPPKEERAKEPENKVTIGDAIKDKHAQEAKDQAAE